MTYVIDLVQFGIHNDGTNAPATTAGINSAITWAKAQGHNHILLPNGTYKVKMDPVSFSAIIMQSGMHFEMDDGCSIEMETNSSPNYNIFQLKSIDDVKISGGAIVGDKKTHVYEIYIGFERGGINADGSYNTNPNWIRSKIIDRYEHPGLLSTFRLWNTSSALVATGYRFYQYKNIVSSATLVGSRADGGFAPTYPTGRGWFLNNAGGIVENNKMVLAIDITASPLTDTEIADLSLKIDNSYYTHESGHGIGLYGSNHIELVNIDISNCTGDGILTGWAQYQIDPLLYTQEQMGQHISIHSCNIHHCRRQGISLCASNDTFVYHNNIHDIGYDDDGVTTNFRNGTAPMFGIDIESMVGESNIPYKMEDRPNGLELNYRIIIKNNYIHNNNRGHFVNADGTNLTIESNTFEGYNVGGVSSHPGNTQVKFLNNTFLGCELWVQGDNFVNGADFVKGNLRFLDVRGAAVNNIRIKDGIMYGSSVYGYFGTPSVNAVTGTFTYATPHGMGNGAKICFEQWIGSVPTGISVDKLYYTVNITSTSFQVSETKGGAPVVISDVGVAGFNISRFNYGRCYITNITVERDWRNDNASSPNFSLLAAGAVIRNVTVKNYDVSVLVPQNYVGRPNTIEGLTLIEGGARFEGCHLSGGKFVRAKTGALGKTDIQFGSTSAQYTRRIQVQDSSFHLLGAVLDGNALVTDCQFIQSAIVKGNNDNKAIIADCYLENTNVNFYWINKVYSATVAKCVFNNVVVTGTSPYVILLDNTTL
ncbi:right-handed parallel beta-helix repeat-containing protein [Cohnella sp. WQ 127256]|uniref:right-handed parallel beta-helix repeat-containing protein n=1 Tax=Cohnella sp. WQ 127256 TaxID=2938790 RepID=UPI0021191612|nr:right-handed parallel beta-helix repeat-containing protein [Cohnella sp. WQ 127256]